jgi:hypothetical protein
MESWYVEGMFPTRNNHSKHTAQRSKGIEASFREIPACDVGCGTLAQTGAIVLEIVGPVRQIYKEEAPKQRKMACC